MKRLLWFTHTNIACKESNKLEFDLTEFISIFIEKELWGKTRYRTEYNDKFEKTDLEKLKSIKFIIYTEVEPFSNFHRYEKILSQYIDLSKIERNKLFASGISEAKKIFIVETEFNSENKIIENLTYEQEKDIETVFDNLTYENHDAWQELKIIKSIICEFIQFFIFNLHLNYLTYQYTFSVTNKPEPIGFTVTSENKHYYYEIERLELLSHYILYAKENDNLKDLMKTTSSFWCKDISSIHFFLDALKGNYITSTSFTKLVFTIESFFGKGISNDYITLTIPLLISENIMDMKRIREILRKSFQVRNEIVHGNSVINFLDESHKRNISGAVKEMAMDDLFFELKNIITRVFYFYLNKSVYLREGDKKISHDLIFMLLPKGIK
jgi:hypothetical protein